MTIKRCYPVLVGASVVENQLCNDESVTVPNGHKYYLKTGGIESLGSSTGTAITGLTSGTDMVIDLTQKLGSSIADYIYSLETATAGAGIAKLKEWGFFTGGYIPHNSGSLESVQATAHKMTGFNQWDEEWEVGGINVTTGEPYPVSTRIRSKNYIPVVPNAVYYHKTQDSMKITGALVFYDADKNYVKGGFNLPNNRTFNTPENARYIKFSEPSEYGSTYNHDICINLSDPDKNGTYEPYVSQTYDLGTDTLRGLFKLDADNRLYADGDRKASDGTVTRKYGVRAYQSGDESLVDAITDGINTVYKLVTPTTEQSTPFTSPQLVYPDGTETFVTENGVPVGHYSKYQL